VQVNRVVVGVSGSAGSLTALRYAASFAWGQQATLVPVLAWTPPGGDLADRRFPCAELRAAWLRDANERLDNAIGLGIGGPPDGIGFEPRTVRGEAGRVLAGLAAEPGDVLVIGTGRHGWRRGLVAGAVARYCLAHSTCPVVAVPPGRLADSAHGLRGWMDRHRVQPEDALLGGDR
jgi:nucleotide-binding universal stress UspA family protein